MLISNFGKFRGNRDIVKAAVDDFVGSVAEITTSSLDDLDKRIVKDLNFRILNSKKKSAPVSETSVGVIEAPITIVGSRK